MQISVSLDKLSVAPVEIVLGRVNYILGASSDLAHEAMEAIAGYRLPWAVQSLISRQQAKASMGSNHSTLEEFLDTYNIDPDGVWLMEDTYLVQLFVWLCCCGQHYPAPKQDLRFADDLLNNVHPRLGKSVGYNLKKWTEVEDQAIVFSTYNVGLV